MPLIKLTCKSGGNGAFAWWEAQEVIPLSQPVITPEQKLWKKPIRGMSCCPLQGLGVGDAAKPSSCLSLLTASGGEIHHKGADIDPGAADCHQ